MGAHSAEDTKDTVAKVGFMAFMAAAMGPVGVLVAALSVGITEAFDGDAGRTTSQDLSRDRVEAERQWLAEDRAFRERLRADRRRWIDEDKADPAKEPSGPSRAEVVGRWWRRLWARLVVFADDFKRGFRDGWHAAKDARERGADWRETARTRPDKPEADDLDWSGFKEPKADEDPAPAPVLDVPTEPVDDQPPLSLVKPEPEPSFDDQGDETMTTPNGPSNGESNVSVLRQLLQRIGGTISKVEAGVDDLGRLADALAVQVREATEFATQTGQIAATKVALDSANAVVQKLKALVAAASEAAVEAVDQVASARASLRVAEAAEDGLRQAGGTGDAVATARAA